MLRKMAVESGRFVSRLVIGRADSRNGKSRYMLALLMRRSSSLNSRADRWISCLQRAGGPIGGAAGIAGIAGSSQLANMTQGAASSDQRARAVSECRQRDSNYARFLARPSDKCDEHSEPLNPLEP